MEDVFLGLGSNLGEREENIQGAIDSIDNITGVRVVLSSSLIETEPVGITDQPEFINAAIKTETSLSPQELFSSLVEIEKSMGRVRTIRWGPRIIDIDILLFGGRIIENDYLIIPHPEMTKRSFVLMPLAEIAPEVIHPVEKRTIKGLLDKLKEI